MVCLFYYREKPKAKNARGKNEKHSHGGSCVTLYSVRKYKSSRVLKTPQVNEIHMFRRQRTVRWYGQCFLITSVSTSKDREREREKRKEKKKKTQPKHRPPAKCEASLIKKKKPNKVRLSNSVRREIVMVGFAV